MPSSSADGGVQPGEASEGLQLRRLCTSRHGLPLPHWGTLSPHFLLPSCWPFNNIRERAHKAHGLGSGRGGTSQARASREACGTEGSQMPHRHGSWGAEDGGAGRGRRDTSAARGRERTVSGEKALVGPRTQGRGTGPRGRRDRERYSGITERHTSGTYMPRSESLPPVSHYEQTRPAGLTSRGPAAVLLRLCCAARTPVHPSPPGQVLGLQGTGHHISLPAVKQPPA